MTTAVCTVCAKTFSREIVKKYRLFCSYRCYKRHWKGSTGWESFTPGEWRTCAHEACKKLFRAYDRRKIFCSMNCRQCQYLKRKAAGLTKPRPAMVEAHRRRKQEAAEDIRRIEAQRKSQAAFNRLMGINVSER